MVGTYFGNSSMLIGLSKPTTILNFIFQKHYTNIIGLLNPWQVSNAFDTKDYVGLLISIGTTLFLTIFYYWSIIILAECIQHLKDKSKVVPPPVLPQYTTPPMLPLGMFEKENCVEKAVLLQEEKLKTCERVYSSCDEF
jgi:hypothetical protein